MIVVMIAHLVKHILLSVKSNQADMFVIKHVLFFHLQRRKWQHFMLALLCFSVVMCTSETSGGLEPIKKAAGGWLLAVISKLSPWTLHLMMMGAAADPFPTVPPSVILDYS